AARQAEEAKSGDLPETGCARLFDGRSRRIRRKSLCPIGADRYADRAEAFCLFLAAWRRLPGLPHIGNQECVTGEREVWCDATAALATVNGYEIRCDASHYKAYGKARKVGLKPKSGDRPGHVLAKLFTRVKKEVPCFVSRPVCPV